MSLILGLDISTTCTGITVLNPINNKIEFQHALKLKQDSIWQKCDAAQKCLLDIKQQFSDIQYVGVERPLKRFAEGGSSATIVSLLQRFNGIVSYIAYTTFGVEPEFVDVGHVRKLCGIKMLQRKFCGLSQKEQTAQWLLEHDLSGINFDKKRGTLEEEKCTIHNIQAHVFDMIDSYVIAKGILLTSYKK